MVALAYISYQFSKTHATFIHKDFRNQNIYHVYMIFNQIMNLRVTLLSQKFDRNFASELNVMSFRVKLFLIRHTDEIVICGRRLHRTYIFEIFIIFQQ